MALGAAVGAAAMAVTSQGDALLLGVLLGIAASDLAAGAAGVLGGLAVLGRWGSTSLAAAAGGQAVIGPAAWTGSTALVISSWCVAAALVLAVPRAPVAIGAFGLAAAALVTGPATGGGTSAATVGLRVGSSLVLVILAWVCSQVVPRRVARPAAVALAGLAAFTASV